MRSLNIPTVKILEQVGVSWVIDYARRLGIFSPLNADLSLGLGSSSITLYEMTRAFGEFGRQGKRLRPLIVNKVLDRDGNELLKDLSLDAFFDKELAPIEKEYEEKRLAHLASLESKETATGSTEPDKTEQATPPREISKRKTPLIYFNDPDQLMTPQTAYVMTSLLQRNRYRPYGYCRSSEIAWSTRGRQDWYNQWVFRRMVCRLHSTTCDRGVGRL